MCLLSLQDDLKWAFADEMMPARKEPEREKEGQRDHDPTQESHGHCSFKSAAMVWSTSV